MGGLMPGEPAGEVIVVKWLKDVFSKGQPALGKYSLNNIPMFLVVIKYPSILDRLIFGELLKQKEGH